MGSQTIFAELRNILAELYPEEQDARVVVSDAGLDPRQIAFSSRAQTNWHNILAEAIRQNGLDVLLQVVRAIYGNNPAFQAAYDQYRQWVDQGGHIEPPPSLAADSNPSPTIATGGGTLITGYVTADTGDVIGRDQYIDGDKVGKDKIEGDQIDARDSKGFINRPSAPVTQHFETTVKVDPKIPKPIAGILLAGFVAVVLLVGAIALYTRGTFQAMTAPTATATPTVPTIIPTMTPVPTATPLAFATQAVSETLIVIATFHGQAAIAHEPHIKISRAITNEAAKHNEQELRVEVEPTELTADQRAEAEALGKLYNASMVIWGEDTGVEVIVNFLNLREPDFAASAVKVNTTEQEIDLAKPDVYQRFITRDLPQKMSFFAFFAVGQSYYLNTLYALATKRVEAAISLVAADAKLEGLTEAYFRLGWLYQFPRPNNLNVAITHYNKAIALNPNYAEAYNNRGIIYYDQGKLDEAIADYTRSIELKNPELHFPYNNRGHALADQNRLDEAIADYNQAIQLKLNYALAYNNRGWAYYSQGKLDGAIADYNKAIQLDPKLAFAYNNRGIISYDQGKLDDALADYNHAIELKPDDVEAYNNRGNAYYDQGKLDGAIADYNKAIELNPDFALAYFNRGNAYYDQGKLDEAIADYDKAIQLKPDYEDAYFNRGNAHKDQGKLDEAIADYDKAIQLDPNDAINLNGLGNARFDQGKLDEAIVDYDKAIRLQPDYAEAYNNRGHAHADQGKLDEAILNYDKAIQLQPDFALAYNNRGWAYYNQGKLDEAIADYNKAIQLDPKLAFPYNNLGIIHYDQGKLDEAIVDYDKAIQLQPDDAEAYNNRGWAYYNQGKLDEAISDYRRYLQLRPDAEDRAKVEQRIAEAEAELAKPK